MLTGNPDQPIGEYAQRKTQSPMTRVQVHCAVGVTFWAKNSKWCQTHSPGGHCGLACLLLRWDTFALCIGHTGLVSSAHKLKLNQSNLLHL
eukprot:5054786-Amphidinium_carterae.2